MLELKKTLGTYDEEEGRQDVIIDILVDGQEVGNMAINEYEDGAVLERFDIKDDHQNKGYGTKAFEEIAKDYYLLVIAPDNEDAKRLYDRIAEEMPEHLMDEWFALDQGYGLYVG